MDFFLGRAHADKCIPEPVLRHHIGIHLRRQPRHMRAVVRHHVHQRGADQPLLFQARDHLPGKMVCIQDDVGPELLDQGQELPGEHPVYPRQQGGEFGIAVGAAVQRSKNLRGMLGGKLISVAAKRVHRAPHMPERVLHAHLCARQVLAEIGLHRLRRALMATARRGV